MATSFSTALRPATYLTEPRWALYCEPYVLVTRIHFACSPDVAAFLYGPWEGGRRAGADMIPLVRRQGFWELNLPVAPGRADDVLFLIALLEHLDGADLRQRVRRALLAELDAAAGMAPAARLARLIDRTDRAVDLANGGPNVTSAMAVRLRPADLRALHRDGARRFVLSFSGYGGPYCLHLKLRKAEADLPRVEAMSRVG